MRDKYAAPETDSPPAQPSTWQLRFGKKSASRVPSQQDESDAEVDTRSNLRSEARSPSIAEQLLRALDAKQREQEELSRECADVLIGRRNVFAGEPELRLRTQTKHSENVDIPIQNDLDHANVAVAAKEIIRVRFLIETQANALRQAPGHRKPTQRRSELKHRPRVHPSTTTTTKTLNSFVSYRSAGLRQTASWSHEEKETRACLVESENDNQKSEVRPTKKDREFQRQTLQRLEQASRNPGRKSRSRMLPPQKLPMERRQDLLQQAREARKLKAAEEQAMLKPLKPVSTDNNKDEMQEQRHIEEQIELLTLENQQAAALEERLQHRKARLKSLSKVFEGWRQYVESKRGQEARVTSEFNWRVLMCFMTSWKRYTHRQRQAREAERARLELVREQQMNERAQRFHRLKCLPSWFYRWTTFVDQQKERRVAEGATARRKAQTKRLMERLLRQKTVEHNPAGVCNKGGEELPEEPTIEHAPRKREPKSRSRQTSIRLREHKRMINAWSATEEHQTTVPDHYTPTEIPTQVFPLPHFPETTTTRATKRVDTVYKAMEQRAIERKQRRDELKRRYEEIEQKKRAGQEEQRAAHEALLLQQRKEEKARIRERKFAEALELKGKQDRRDHMLAQRHKANKHNRRRLLFYYALLPWRTHHALNERVVHNAGRWHELRTVYSHWKRWHEFVQICRKLRRRRERAQLEEAAKHYARFLQQRVLRALMRHHQATEARALAVQRQNQWDTLQRSWTHWYKRLASERTYQRKIVFEAAAKMQHTKLRRIYAQWYRATSDAKVQKELEREKQLLWRKVRGWLDEDA